MVNSLLIMGGETPPRISLKKTYAPDTQSVDIRIRISYGDSMTFSPDSGMATRKQ
jgi:hypothetical protein